MAEIVLVHGAWSDGSVWLDVIPALHRQGHRVRTAHLPFTPSSLQATATSAGDWSSYRSLAAVVSWSVGVSLLTYRRHTRRSSRSRC